MKFNENFNCTTLKIEMLAAAAAQKVYNAGSLFILLLFIELNCKTHGF